MNTPALFQDYNHTTVKSLSQENADNQVLIIINAYEELWNKVSLYPAA